MISISQLKSLNMDKVLDTDEAIALSAEARAFESEYEQLELPVPGWLTTAINTLRSEIAQRVHASDLNRVQELEREIDGYKTTTEKRSEAVRKLADLQKKLGLTASKPGR